MAMIDIEYRYSGEVDSNADIRRKSVLEFDSYIRSLVLEMQMADISAGYKKKKVEKGPNAVYINGVLINKILDGLHIVSLGPDEDTCGCDGTKPIKIERPSLDWDEKYVEDIPDVLMKNAIAKVYADIQSNLVNVKQD